jgi:hypothetical protein
LLLKTVVLLDNPASDVGNTETRVHATAKCITLFFFLILIVLFMCGTEPAPISTYHNHSLFVEHHISPNLTADLTTRLTTLAPLRTHNRRLQQRRIVPFFSAMLCHGFPHLMLEQGDIAPLHILP